MGRVEPTAVERRTSDFVAVCTSDSRVSELQSFFVVSSLSFPSTLPARALRLSFFALSVRLKFLALCYIVRVWIIIPVLGEVATILKNQKD